MRKKPNRTGCRWSADEDYTLEECLSIICESNYREFLPERSFDSIRNHITERGLERQRVTRKGLCYTTEEAATVLGVSRKQLRRWIIAGMLHGEKIPSLKGRKFTWAVAWSAIDDFLTEYSMIFNDLPPRAIFAHADHHKALYRAQREHQYLTPASVARKHGVSYQTVIRWIHEGRIQAKRVQGAWYIVPAWSVKRNAA